MPYKDPEKTKKCIREWMRKDRKKNPEKHKQAKKKWVDSHREMVLAQRRRWYYKHREEQLERAKTRNKERRKIVIEHYGGKCSCCGESVYEFLTIEHKNGGGRKHREKIGAPNIAKWIIDNNFPKEFDVLCYNCNCSKAFSGICPHKVKGQN